MHPEEDGGPSAVQLEGVERFLKLEPRSRVLDLGCGDGRRALQVARRGHRVLGADSEDAGFAAARSAAKAERLNAHFAALDARAMPYRSEFDAVLWLDDGCGRLASDREDLRALESVRKSLKPGAPLLIDVVNREWLVRHFEPNFWEQGEEGRGPVVLDRVSLDLEKGRLDNHRVIVSGDGRRTPQHLSLRLYALTELKAQLERAQLAYRQCWGGFDGRAYGMDSPRMIVLAERSRDEKGRRTRPDDGLPKAIRIKGRR